MGADDEHRFTMYGRGGKYGTIILCMTEIREARR
jgi:hypothetical protein